MGQVLMQLSTLNRGKDLLKLNTILSRQELVELQSNPLIFKNKIKLPKANVFLSNGVYFRELTLPANVMVIGETHKYEHLFMVLKGKAKLISTYENLIVKAGYISKAPPLTKRLVITFEETTFANIHSNPDNIEDLDLLYSMYTESDQEFKGDNKCLLQQ